MAGGHVKRNQERAGNKQNKRHDKFGGASNEGHKAAQKKDSQVLAHGTTPLGQHKHGGAATAPPATL